MNGRQRAKIHFSGFPNIRLGSRHKKIVYYKCITTTGKHQTGDPHVFWVGMDCQEMYCWLLGVLEFDFTKFAMQAGKNRVSSSASVNK